MNEPDHNAVVFPHTDVDARDRELLASAFGRVTVCVPWYADPPGHPGDERTGAVFGVVRPPEHMKPKSRVKPLLSEYYLWMRHNRDKGYGAFLKASTGVDPEEAPWELRRLIGGRAHGSLPEETDRLRRHLILHLARDYEANRRAVEDELRTIGRHPSPLSEAMGDEDGERAPSPDFHTVADPRFPPDDELLEQVMEAWCGLFGDVLTEEAVLVTFEPRVLTIIAGWYDRLGVAVPTHGTVRLPALREPGHGPGPHPVLGAVAGRTLVVMAQGA